MRGEEGVVAELSDFDRELVEECVIIHQVFKKGRVHITPRELARLIYIRRGWQNINLREVRVILSAIRDRSQRPQIKFLKLRRAVRQHVVSNRRKPLGEQKRPTAVWMELCGIEGDFNGVSISCVEAAMAYVKHEKEGRKNGR